MFTIYAMAGIAVVIIGLWVTVKFMSARNAQLKVEKQVAEANLEQAGKVIESIDKVEEVLQERQTVREERVKEKVKKDVETDKFNSFYD